MKRFFVLAAMAFVLWIALLPHKLFDHSQIFVFQTRDLYRAAQLLSGNLIFFGPEITGGGNLPGPFYYYLLAPALCFGGWETAWGWMMLIFCMGAGGAAMYFKLRYSTFAACLLLVILGLAPLSLRFLKIFLNVSFLPAFALAALIAICESWRAATEAARIRWLRAAFFLLGLGVQLHLSIASWVIALMLLQRWRRGVPEAGIRLRAFVSSLGFFVLPLLPWAAWYALEKNGVHFGQPRMFTGSEGRVVPTYLEFLQLLRDLQWVDLLMQAPKLLEAMPAPLLLLVPLGFFVAGGAEARKDSIERPAMACVLFGLIPFCFYFLVPIGFRYGLGLYLPLVFIAVERLERIRQHPASAWRFSLGAILAGAVATAFVPGIEIGLWILEIFALACAAAFLGAAASARGAKAASALLLVAVSCVCYGQQHLIGTGALISAYLSYKIMPSIGAWREIWRTIHGATGWSFEEAAGRTFFLQHHMEQDPRPVFDYVKRQGGMPELIGRRPDGFFVSYAKQERIDDLDWLASRTIPSELKRALSSGAIRLAKRSMSKNFLVLPYFVERPEEVPTLIHNHGQGYFRSVEDTELDRFTGEAAVERVADGSFLFYWNECPGFPKYCASAAKVRLERKSGRSWGAKVRIIGSPLSQVSPWISPDWTESWQYPYLEVSCGGRKVRMGVAEGVGYDRRFGVQRSNYPFNYNHSFIAPFERTLSFTCPGGPEEVAFGRSGSLVDTVKSVRKLPPRHLSIRLREGSK